ncbi:GntR family transcriptional regulator [Cryobacterium breve]|uniref:GntR family transcriptional regulator n=1 Tax=Cryobacterium breve TaxID=1259258 RepID=A0ABY7NAF0_9MICO|nr:MULTISPECIES: GntR family transcriptional regulator [Cryobacterium]MEB0000739.1 GntR family transcriptional regulator [Cryobacterium sp. RTS3]WBM78972.1 GntR family transcriptional regulator [Cryobacterium breve]
MKLTVDEHSPTPPFEQLRLQVLEAVRTGAVAPGDKLPTVRRLADELGLAPNTVARAYRELEQGEVIETRGRLGSFIAATGDPTRRQAQRAAAEFAERMRALGLATDDALALVSAALGIRP